MEQRLLDLVGTKGTMDVMIINGTIYERWEFEDSCEKGYFPRRIVKQGWQPTHQEEWIWKSQRSSFSPFDESLVKAEWRVVGK